MTSHSRVLLARPLYMILLLCKCVPFKPDYAFSAVLDLASLP